MQKKPQQMDALEQALLNADKRMNLWDFSEAAIAWLKAQKQPCSPADLELFLRKHNAQSRCIAYLFSMNKNLKAQKGRFCITQDMFHSTTEAKEECKTPRLFYVKFSCRPPLQAEKEMIMDTLHGKVALAFGLNALMPSSVSLTASDVEELTALNLERLAQAGFLNPIEK